VYFLYRYEHGTLEPVEVNLRRGMREEEEE
jgi:hypothetical protein